MIQELSKTAKIMKNEFEILKDISERFDKIELPFMLTGSFAMSYYANPRMTRDLDFVIELDTNKIDSLVKVVENDYIVSFDVIKESFLHKSMFNLIHKESLIKVDCIIRKDEKYRKIEFDRRQKIILRDFTTYIVSKEDLILSKCLWMKESYSEMQIRDIKNILSTGCDQNYLQEYIKILGLEELFKQIFNG
jgi:hypothetical protein